ncbi:AraC family transcriptional regulator [Paenibacillus sp. IB182496]|uniref:AraC family transcriptional regulator n=1 Tax=Paenibacillus sabuli TaxID=2772509 RepID=A0A927BRK1_9BACL|nr:AraC family transcriptional regulator [Paenibacillus sabuli]MBD2844390.1 AraC family transcriptional regulator [Paenibacillus sabuli]
MREGNNQVFTPEMVEKMAYIWTRSSISFMDVRHQTIYPNQPLRQYKMPSSTLVYAYGGSAHVQLNETAFAMERFGLFHGGKGTMLSITPEEAVLRSYMVLYKAETPHFFKRDLQRLLEQVNPFVQQFGYAPSNPVWLIHLFEQMMDSWRRATALNHFHTKNLFYQSMYEVYEDLEQEQAMFLQPDPVISAKRYLDEHYTQPIMFQEIAGMFAISGGQLTRLFKKREGQSLQEYLTMKRLEAARHQLENTTATIREIANGCGLVDENTLFRMFKKYYKVSPGDYRKKLVVMMQGYTIDNDYHHLYNEIGLENLAKSQRDGEYTMFGQVRSKQMILAAAMSLMLLLSACTSATPSNTGGATNQVPTPTQQVQTTADSGSKGAEAAARTRTVSTVMGDVEVPADPQRVVVNWYAGDVITLGLNVVGSTIGLKNDSYKKLPYAEQLEYIPFIEKWEPEEIMALDPDLIVTYQQEDFEKLKGIAPVLVITGDEKSALERLLFLGEATGRSDKALQLIDEFEAELADAKKLIASERFNGKTFTINQDWGATGEWAGIAFETESRGGTVLYEYLGMTLPDQVTSLLKGDGNILSYEVAHQYFGDYIIWIENPQMESEYQKTAFWSSIPAVSNQHVVTVPKEQYGLFFFADVASMTAQLSYITELLRSLD